MKKKMIVLLFVMTGILALQTGCGSRTPAGERKAQESEQGSPVSEQAQDTEMQAKDNETSAQESEQETSMQEQVQEEENTESESGEEENNEMKMNVNVNGQDFTATLEQNSAAEALMLMMEEGDVTLQLNDYAGFEKVGPLGQSLPADDRQTTTHAGDIVLYQGNQIVMFYGSNSWSYTRLGHIDDLTGWEEALGSGDVTAVLSLPD